VRLVDDRDDAGAEPRGRAPRNSSLGTLTAPPAPPARPLADHHVDLALYPGAHDV